MMAVKKREVPAIFAEDAEPVLDRLGVGDAYRAGELLCDSCGEPINARGLGAIRMLNGKVQASCARIECLKQISP
jgi:hypothetical protein